MSELSSDDRLITRYVDGQMASDERLEFESRLEAEPGLKAQVERSEQVRRCFEGSADDVVTPSVGFVDRVVRVARRLPSREELAGEEPVSSAAEAQPAEAPPVGTQPAEAPPVGTQPAEAQPVGTPPAGSQPVGALAAGEWARLTATIRHALVAAVLVCGAAFVVFGGVLRQTDTGRLQASPQELRELDARIERERRGADRGEGPAEQAGKAAENRKDAETRRR